jgi:hypothetical protein
MSNDTKTEHVLTSRADALKLLRGFPVNTRIYLHIFIDAQLPATPDKYIPDAFNGSVKISRDEAEKFVNDAFTDTLEKRGAALNISEHVGDRRKRWNDKAGAYVEYGEPRRYVWIG